MNLNEERELVASYIADVYNDTKGPSTIVVELDNSTKKMFPNLSLVSWAKEEVKKALNTLRLESFTFTDENNRKFRVGRFAGENKNYYVASLDKYSD